ncbi:hypothetical protein [Mycoplasmopsis columbina]|nr:hypothetical protein [Mycoplasmopsis columbina]
MKKFKFYSLLSVTTIPTVFVAVSCSESKTDQEKKDYISYFLKEWDANGYLANIPNINPEYLNKINEKLKEQSNQTYSEFNENWKKVVSSYKNQLAFLKLEFGLIGGEEKIKDFINTLKADETKSPILISGFEKISVFAPRFVQSFEFSDDAYTTFKDLEKMGLLTLNLTQEEKTELMKSYFDNIEELSPGLLVKLGILKENKEDQEKSPEEENTENNPKTNNEESSTPTNGSNENSNTNETSPTA